MKKSRFILHYEHLLNSFDTYFERVLVRLNKRDLHQLRVSIKKIRAMWAMMDEVDHVKWDKKAFLGSYAKLFKEAGKLREAQVNQKLVEKYRDQYLDPYIRNLGIIQEKAYKNLLKETRAFNRSDRRDLNRELPKKILKLSDREALKISVGYALKKAGKIRQLSKSSGDTRTMHKIRIHLRALNETLLIILELDAETGLDSFQKKTKFLIDKIGKWHDYTVLRSSLKRQQGTLSKKKDIRHLDKFIAQIEQEIEKRQEKLYKLLHNYITKRQLKQIGNTL